MDARSNGSALRDPKWSRINQWLLWLGLAAAVGWLYFRHNEHLLQLAPFLLVLACPLMHLFGHGSHRHQARHGGAEQDPEDERANARPHGHAH